MASMFGRSVIVPLTNKSGGGVVAGDVVVVDTTTDESFTTTTSAANTSAIGVAAETIANNATGRIIVGGYAPLVNVNASVTRNQFGTTHTVAKQAVASATRVAGTFCRWLKTSATPSAYIYPVDLAGAALTDPTSNRGEIIRRGASGLEALQAKTSGKVLVGDGTDVVSAYPPGYELDYVQITSNASITATTEGTAQTVITSSAITFDGAAVIVEFYSEGIKAGNATGGDITILLRDDTGAVVLGDIAYHVSQAANDNYVPCLVRRRFTPAAGSRTYSIRAFVSTGTGVILAGAGGTGNTPMPAFLRFSKV